MVLIFKMFAVSLFKIKLMTILCMVFMGLFSRLVLGFPLLLPISLPTFHVIPQNPHFPNGGARTSLRFLSALRYIQKRRRIQKDGRATEEEITLLQPQWDSSQFEFVGEVIEQEAKSF